MKHHFLFLALLLICQSAFSLSDERLQLYKNNGVIINGVTYNSNSKIELDEVSLSQFESSTEFQSKIQTGQSIAQAAAITSFIYTLEKETDDKVKHYLVGAIIGGVVTYIGKVFFKDKKDAKIKTILSAASTALVVGILKEVYDNQGHGYVEDKDIFYTALGGASGSIISYGFDF